MKTGNHHLIKFRAWNLERNKWEGPKEGVSLQDFTHTFGDYTDNLVFQQWIGANDKNGKPIFIGDLVKFDGFDPVEVKYPLLNPENFNGSQHEVIGNIFENPELL